MAIISVSRRSDVPAFYGEWFARRLRQGTCLVRHPWRPDLAKRVDLSSEAVDGFVFWTRHPEPFLRHLDQVDRLGRPYYFFQTITGLGSAWEPRLPSLETCLDEFRRLARRLGPDRTIWRFDPVLLGRDAPPRETLARFARLCDLLAGSTREVVTSVVCPYAKIRKRLEKAGLELTPFEEAPESWRDLLGRLAETARANGLVMRSCAAEEDLSGLGISPGRCVDAQRLAELGGTASVHRKDPGQRPACACSISVDIGAYNTCAHGCLYCYANQSPALAQRNLAQHDPDSPHLA